jgi:DNA-3-methyladenine glycosylase
LTLPRDFYARPVEEVAPDLVGCVVRHGETAGRIVEAEAYHESEPACHAFVGLTPRTQVLFGEPGLAYVYRSYGVHALLNAVSDREGVGAAVLIRALEPLEGLDLMRARRGWERPEDLCSGPGKLSQALALSLELNGTSLLDGPIQIAPPPVGARPVQLTIGPRVGITKAMELPWRFCDASSRCVSRPWPPAMRTRPRRAAA